MVTADLDAVIASLGLTYSATFVPQSQSRNKKDKQPTLNWQVGIGKGNSLLVTDYSQGIAHHPQYKQVNPRVIHGDNILRSSSQTGKYNPRNLEASSNGTSPGTKDIPAPLLRDVLYCLVTDADVLNYSDFEEWAMNFGYEADSRAAERTYRDCLKIALQLQAMLGRDTLAKLQEAFQDY